MELIDWCKIVRGQRITIPKEVRKSLGLNVGDAVGFFQEGDKVIFASVNIKVTKRHSPEK